MRRRTLWISVSAVVVLAIAATITIMRVRAVQYEDTVQACKAALRADPPETKADKPAACSGVTADDYLTLVVSNAIGGMSKKDQDTLDYYDNGTIDGSIG
ncbi:hypothetical protein [Streptomyces adustus]|uniref:hypothetical protein n=1 Tax=Streptomyces adustus TaxID=1609272 RepID=UPI003719FA2C